MRVAITGGAGFVGSSLALAFRRESPACKVVAFDNLRRRGSELNLALFKQHGVEFFHGDIRSEHDLEELPGEFDLLIDASAEPSVLAGIDGSPRYVLQTNLAGTLNCLEFARRRAGCFVFLSTSRVYSMEPLRAVNLSESETRFEIAEDQSLPGVTPKGIGEGFPVDLPRSLYGATKLASELIIQEYVYSYGLRAVVNRCGVIAGPGQFGKVDQGVFTLWVANHYFKKPLRYTGFGGSGKQVRDLLHPLDLFDLVKRQAGEPGKLAGEVYNVGGGPASSTSLLELTAHCQRVVGNRVEVGRAPESHAADIPLYVSDNAKVARAFGWFPGRTVPDIIEDIARWIASNEAQLRNIFA